MERRKFIKSVGFGLAAGSNFGIGGFVEAYGATGQVSGSKSSDARVALMLDDGVRGKGGLVSKRVAELLDKAIAASLGSKDAKSGLDTLVKPDDIVGIKLNCLAGRPLSPTSELVQALVELFGRCKVPRSNLLFFERSERDLVKGGFEIVYSGDNPKFLGNDSPDCGYEPRPQFSGQVGSCLSRIVTRKISLLINLGVLKDHNLSGLSAGMKNLFGIIHNPNKYHDNNCNPYVADVSAFSVVRQKLRLTIIDGLTAQCEGGPGYRPEFTWPYNGILASKDPVALDRICLKIIEAKRKEKNLPSLEKAGRSPKWLITAAEKGLGISDLKKIKVIHGA